MRTLVGLVQTCHRLSVSTAERFGKLPGKSLEDAVEGFTQDSGNDAEGKMDYLKLSLGQHQGATGNAKSAPALAFMTMDLRALSDVLGDADGGEKKGRVGSFLEEVLEFVRDHLVSRPLLMAVAAAAERGANGKKGESVDEEIQEGFLLLCEVRVAQKRQVVGYILCC